MRCLTLGEQLRKRAAEVLFVCREHPGHMCDLIESRGFVVVHLPPGDSQAGLDWNRHAPLLQATLEQDAEETLSALTGRSRLDWLIVDHYAIERSWERRMQSITRRIMIIDDLADRLHDCDLLLDQNYFRDFDQRYEGLVPESCQKLLSPVYALLRPEFTTARENLRQRTGMVKKLLVFFGGSDPTDETSKALEAIRSLNPADIHIDVVVGAGNPRRDKVRRLCHDLPGADFHCQVENMAELLANADLSLGAGGSTNWERFALGTPALLVAVADNQEAHSQDLADRGLVSYLGRSEQVDQGRIAERLQWLMRNPEVLTEMSRSGLDLVDGKGADRVADFLVPATGRCSFQRER